MSAEREKKPPRKLATAKSSESYNRFALRAHGRQDVCAPSERSQQPVATLLDELAVPIKARTKKPPTQNSAPRACEK
jgi:hypothetical protein